MKKLIFLIFSGFCLSTVFQPVEASNSNNRLTGSVVKGIVERFVAIHYSQKPLDDTISKEIFKLYLNRLDPGHYYFLEKDIQEFQRYETRLDDMLRRGNIEFALDVFSRFKTRLQQRLQQLEGFLQQEFDFSKDGEWRIKRSEEPYPKDLKAAQEIWRLKIKFDLLTLKLGGTELEEAKNRMMKRVRGLWKDYSQYDDDDVVSLFLNAMANAYDPHSAYMAAQELKNFDISIKLSLDGIGAVLRWEDGYTVVNSVIPGGAAARHGKLRVEDRIIAVAQADEAFESVIDMRLNDVVQLIRGKRGTTVRLQVLRESEIGLDTLKFSIVRDKIVLKEGEAQSHIFEPSAGTKESSNLPELKHRIGVIKLPSFYVDFNDRRKNPNNYKSSSRDVKKHLQKFVDSKVDGLILDLRSNGGGGLDEAITMAGLFIGRNPVVVVRQSGGRRVTVHRSREKTIFENPVLLMLNRYSASASEILAGALQDYQRAVLVGDRTTFGKGTVQNIVQLPEGFGALKITIAQFYRVSGGSTQNKGVEANIIFPSVNNVRDIGESVLENALPWRSIDSVSYSKVQNLEKILGTLNERSNKRVDDSEFFINTKRDIDEYLNNIKPLQYTSILKMQEDHQRRLEEREKEMASAKPKDAAHADASNNIPSDISVDGYLKESMVILEDFIELKNGKTSKL
ncbi:MAG: carboxy terminal-processing peptidase [SAR324 cluster bacterium]|nr:carboxy terminal-processing peptidase [SAR324 cluster bacterium]|tara:strand:- start:2569 stop:4608 length:2040 start_codon:yes stop_codon:yes gene_type:complete